MFHVGQKVVCVNARPWPGHEFYPYEIAKGQIYIISWVGPSTYPGYRGKPSVRLEGIRDRHETPFAAFRFRPIIERKTDISVFQRMLVPAGKRELVEVRGH